MRAGPRTPGGALTTAHATTASPTRAALAGGPMTGASATAVALTAVPAGAPLGQVQGDRTTDTTAGPGHNNGLVTDVHAD